MVEGTAEGAAEALRRRLARLMAARLGLALVVFGLALVWVGAGKEGQEAAERGLYGTLAFAFGATAVFAALLPYATRLRMFGGLQLLTDVGIVTGMLAFSGGGASPFSFLYLPLIVFASLILDRVGAYGAAAAASFGYAAVLWAVPAAGGPPAAVLFGLHGGGFLLVALLASVLARELRVAGERLDRSESNLRELQSLHERTVESLTSGLLTTDASGVVTSFNRAAERITGVAATDACGQPLEALVPGATALAARAAGGKVRARLEVQFADAPRHLGLSTSVLREVDGAPAGQVVIFQDLSDVVRMEEELRRSERLAGVGQLAADIAHEVRNPLAAISGSVQILQGKGSGDPENARLMDIVLREITRLDNLITDFLEYARPAPLSRVATDVGELLHEVAEVVRRSAADGVELEVDTSGDLTASIDPDQVRQLVWNLVRNAEQAVGAHGRIRLGASRVDPSQALPQDGRRPTEEDRCAVEIVVQDSGCGIAADVRARIFDPFFTTKQSGTGLGLATVHRVVEAHGGSATVESEPGKGATFRIRLATAVPA